MKEWSSVFNSMQEGWRVIWKSSPLWQFASLERPVVDDDWMVGLVDPLPIQQVYDTIQQVYVQNKTNKTDITLQSFVWLEEEVKLNISSVFMKEGPFPSMLTPLMESGLELDASMVGDSMAYASYWGFTELPLPPTSILEGMDKLSLKKIHSGRPYIFVMQLIRYISKEALYTSLDTDFVTQRKDARSDIIIWMSKGKAYLEISSKDMERIIIYIFHYFFLYVKEEGHSMENSMARVLRRMDSAWESDPKIGSIFAKANIREKLPQTDKQYFREVWEDVAVYVFEEVYKPKP
jgi:hypothetical protein